MWVILAITKLKIQLFLLLNKVQTNCLHLNWRKWDLIKNNEDLLLICVFLIISVLKENFRFFKILIIKIVSDCDYDRVKQISSFDIVWKETTTVSLG